MKILSNEKLIKRNNRIGQITSIGSLVILVWACTSHLATAREPM